MGIIPLFRPPSSPVFRPHYPPARMGSQAAQRWTAEAGCWAGVPLQLDGLGATSAEAGEHARQIGERDDAIAVEVAIRAGGFRLAAEIGEQDRQIAQGDSVIAIEIEVTRAFGHAEARGNADC